MDLSTIKDKVKEGAQGKMTITLTEEMLLKLMNVKKIDNVKITNVTVEKRKLRIDGTFTKMHIPIHFNVQLRPAYTIDRSIFFKIKKIRPINGKWLRKKIFHQPPMMTMKGKVVGFHLDSVKQLQYIPVGQFDSYYFENRKVHIKLKL